LRRVLGDPDAHLGQVEHLLPLEAGHLGLTQRGLAAPTPRGYMGHHSVGVPDHLQMVSLGSRLLARLALPPGPLPLAAGHLGGPLGERIRRGQLVRIPRMPSQLDDSPLQIGLMPPWSTTSRRPKW